MIAAIERGEKRGKIVLPTGCGKTFLQAALAIKALALKEGEKI